VFGFEKLLYDLSVTGSGSFDVGSGGSHATENAV